MLKNHINGTQQRMLFDTYEDAKLFQIKYGGAITFIKQYEERGQQRTESPIDQCVQGVSARYTSTVAPTGMSLFILNLSAEASLTNGFIYIKEQLMQRHNYLNKSLMLLNKSGVHVYTVETLNRTEDIKFSID